MRKSLILAAVAPLALLAACGDADTETATTDADMAADATANDTAMTADADAAMEADAPPTALADAGDYSGVYYYGTGADERAVRINSAAKTYDYMGSDGVMKSGTYTATPDGYRLWIEDFYGTPAWFSLSNGRLVRLEQDVEITDPTVVVTGERYDRAEEGDAVFSRFPEPGAPVAPTN